MDKTIDDLFDGTMDFDDPPVGDGQPGEEVGPVGNRFERMSLADVSRLASEATDPNRDTADEPAPGPFGLLSDDEFLVALEESKKPVELIDWDAEDVSPGVALARQHVELREAGVDGELAEGVLNGDMPLREAILRREADIEAAQLLEAQPDGLTESLSDTELENLIQASKQGWGDDAVRRLVRQKGLG